MNLRYTGQAPEKEINSQTSKWFEELFSLDEKVIYLDADLMRGLRTNDIWEKYPDRIINCGIQEANMVGVAAGLYLAGYNPYIHSFTPFITRRVYDQLVVSIAYANKSVHIIGTDAGIMASDNGGTHMSFEDVSLIRTIPNSCIIDVTDSVMFHNLLIGTRNRQGVTYFRTPRRNAQDVYIESETFEVGKGKTLFEGQDVTIVACGIMVAIAIEARKILESEGICAKVIDPVTIKPIDKELIISSARETGAIVTAENHNIIGGLGSAVAEVITDSYPVPVLKVGIEDRFGQTGSVDYLKKQYNLVPETIVTKVKQAIGMKGRL